MTIDYDEKAKEPFKIRTSRITIGLKDAAPSDIEALKSKYEKQGYAVTHVTEGLPHNGVLKGVLCYKNRAGRKRENRAKEGGKAF